MNKILILLVSTLVLTGCSADQENLEITNPALVEQLEAFTADLSDHLLYSGKDELTVSVYQNRDSEISIHIWNGVPVSCKDVAGYAKFRNFKVYFLLDGVPNPDLFEPSSEFECDLAERTHTGNPPPPPPNTRYAEVFFRLLDGNLIKKGLKPSLE